MVSFYTVKDTVICQYDMGLIILCLLSFLDSYEVGKDDQLNCESHTPLYYPTPCMTPQGSPMK